MKKIITFLVVLTVICGNAYANCDKVYLPQAERLDSKQLHEELCRYYKESHLQEKRFSKIVKNDKNYRSETYEFCKEQVSVLEQLFAKKFGGVPECP